MMFRGKQRPAGLEFPGCEACNQNTAHSELVACLLARMYPDDPSSNVHNEEVKKLLKAVANNVPGLLQEMHIGAGGTKLALKNLPTEFAQKRVGILRANGPILSNHMRI